MVWSATEVPPDQIRELKTNENLLDSTIFSAPKEHSVYIDKAWHGIHYLLTERADATKTVASKVIMGGESIGPDLGYGPAQLLTPSEVKAIAALLQEQSPEALAKRYKSAKLKQAHIYPEDIWESEGDEALKYLLLNYKSLVVFYANAAKHGYAVILSIH